MCSMRHGSALYPLDINNFNPMSFPLITRALRLPAWADVYDTQWHFSSIAELRGTMAHYIMEYRRMASAP